MTEISREELKKIIGHISEVAIKNWLRISGLQYSAANEDAFYERLQKLIKKNKLTITRLQQLALEIEENSNKRIYLRQIDITDVLKSKPSFEEYLKKIDMTLNEKPDKSIRYPTHPILNYISWSDMEIRIKFSETQEQLKLDRETGKSIFKPVTNYAIAVVDRGNGFTQIRLDPVVDRFPHKDPESNKSRDLLYVGYYFDAFSKILGKCQFQLYDLIKVTDHLIRTKPYIFRLPSSDFLGSDNLEARLRRRDDIRKSDKFKAIVEDDKDSVCQSFSGYWDPEQSDNQIDRELFMSLNRKNSVISFRRDCLGSEVDYAIKRIREA